MKYLITGSSGFIGSRLLNAIDENVTLMSRKNNPNYETFICDFEKNIIPVEAFRSVDVVIHLAGVAHDIKNNFNDIDYYHKINTETTEKLVKIASKSKVKRFVFISTVKAGGEPISGRCRYEFEQDNPVDIYGLTKREAEIKVLETGKETEMQVSIIRPSLVYGPHVKGNLATMAQAIRKGWFPPLPENSNKRSMVHVDDLVRAILIISKNNSIDGEIFVVTDNIEYSSRQIYEQMCIAVGKSVPRWSIPKFIFDLAKKLHPSLRFKINKLLGDDCYSAEKVKKLNFEPTRTLREMNETFF